MRKTRTRVENVISRILSTSEKTMFFSREDPFKTLIRTILSQNTNWRNEETAYGRLEELIGVTAQKLASASLTDIAEAIKPAGIYNTRSRVIKKVSEQVIKKFGGNLTNIISKPYLEARSELMTLSGVGKKTADVVLLFTARKSVIPVDRHISRIIKRLGLVPVNAPYDMIRLTLEKATPPETYLDIHIKLIKFGRDICKAQNPLCIKCFLKDICLYPQREALEQPLIDKQPYTNPKYQKTAE